MYMYNLKSNKMKMREKIYSPFVLSALFPSEYGEVDSFTDAK